MWRLGLSQPEMTGRSLRSWLLEYELAMLPWMARSASSPFVSPRPDVTHSKTGVGIEPTKRPCRVLSTGFEIRGRHQPPQPVSPSPQSLDHRPGSSPVGERVCRPRRPMLFLQDFHLRRWSAGTLGSNIDVHQYTVLVRMQSNCCNGRGRFTFSHARQVPMFGPRTNIAEHSPAVYGGRTADRTLPAPRRGTCANHRVCPTSGRN
jgi:hypothetical protein